MIGDLYDQFNNIIDLSEGNNLGDNYDILMF